jgi:hypothetical protein
LALVYALLVVAMNVAELGRSVPALLYVAAALVAPLVVIIGDRRARAASTSWHLSAQVAAGTLAGMWALPSTSGLVAILAAFGGALAVRSGPGSRVFAALALIAGAVVGVALLALTLR